MKLKIVLLTIDRAGQIMLERLAGVLSDYFEIALVITREDRDYDFNGNPVVNTCRKLGIKYLQPDFKDNMHINAVTEVNPDLIIVCNFHKIIKSGLIDIPKLGAFNVHSSYLPESRGGTSIIWALKSGSEETGVTLHEITAGIDDGDIISQKKVPISFWDTQGSLYTKITLAKFDLLVDFLTSIAAGEQIPRFPQDHSKATYLPKRNDEDGLLGLEADLLSLYNHIRSFDPWTGAYFEVDGVKIRLRSVLPVNYLIPSSVSADALVLSRENQSNVQSLIIHSVTDVIETPDIFDKRLAERVLALWRNSAV
jgi:methionyl-tRNA formyltransferase